jgi:uncharacterized membrane protein
MNNIPADYKSYFEKFVANLYKEFYDEYDKPKALKIVSDNSNKFQRKLDELIYQLEKQNQSDQVLFITNSQFLELMEISQKKALLWRKNGVVNYFQIGSKILYKVYDIQLLIKYLS